MLSKEGDDKDLGRGVSPLLTPQGDNRNRRFLLLWLVTLQFIDLVGLIRRKELL